MRVFVAGATGVLGRATVPLLVSAGHQVRGIARTAEKAVQLRAQGAEPVEGVELFDPDAVRRALAEAEAETVVHMATSIPPAAKAWRGRSWSMHDRLRREATPILADAARDVGTRRFVKESVCFFYVPQGDAWIDEDSPMDRTNFADATLAAEEAAIAFGDGDRTGVVLRFGLFYGADARSLGEGMTMARLGTGPMVGRPDAYQPSIHVGDAAAAILASLDAPTGAYNVADDPVTKGEWNAAFLRAFGIDRRSRALPELAFKAGGEKVGALAGSRRISSQRFRDATGWAPAFPDAAIGLEAVAAEHRGSGR